MKNNYLLLIVFSVLFSFGISKKVQSQNETTMGPIVRQGMNYVNDIEESNEIVRLEFDILNTTKQNFRNLSDSWEYTIYAFGDYRIKTLNMKVYESDGNNGWDLVKQSYTSDATVKIIIKPSKAALYRFDVIPVEFAPDYTVGHYGLIVYHEKPK